jgi:uncharacterized protein
MTPITVTGLALTAVKGMRLREVDSIQLSETGALGNRRFYVIDDRGRMVNGKVVRNLQVVVPDYDAEAGVLTLAFPDGTDVGGAVAYGETLTSKFFSGVRESREVTGPWAAALSEFFGRPLRLAATDTAVDRGLRGAASIISRASLRRLAEQAERDWVDTRRFRMLIEIDGVRAHEEDRWVGRRVRVGESVLEMHGHVGRCLITSRDPDTADVDLPTLDLLASYRGDEDSTEPLPFGIYGGVLEGGSVRLGDPVSVDGWR